MVEGFRGGNQERIANLDHGEFKPSFFLLQPRRLTVYTVRITPSVKLEDLAFFFEINRLTASWSFEYSGLCEQFMITSNLCS
jgi:hypothetical protein